MAQPLPIYQPPQPSNQPSNGIIWVQGESGAKSYLVAPGNTVMLMDSEGSKFYIKSADNAGMPTLRTFEFKECGAVEAREKPLEDTKVQFATHDEIEALNGRIERVEAQMEETVKKATKLERLKKAVSEDD